MKELMVDLGERSYPIFIAQGLLDQAEAWSQFITGQSAVVVSNETVAPLYLDKITAVLERQGLKHTSVILPDGEQYKSMDCLNTIFDALIEGRFDRNTTLIALGGGVIGDITGFAAAAYMRGVNFIQMPTTLLSQVDSSVGGKTGVNHPGGKNMIGAFYQPKCVVIDTDTLDTLEDKQLSAGLAEVIKYGLIVDESFLTWIEQNMDALLARDKAILAQAIACSCQIKADVVAEDEREAGKRALLNLGHTFGHAIEAAMGYGNWLHGEAIAAGMVQAAKLSQLEGWIDTADVARIEAIFQAANLPIVPPESLGKDEFYRLMTIDKKVIDGVMRLVLLKAIGNAVVTDDYTHDNLNQVL